MQTQQSTKSSNVSQSTATVTTAATTSSTSSIVIPPVKSTKPPQVKERQSRRRSTTKEALVQNPNSTNVTSVNASTTITTTTQASEVDLPSSAVATEPPKRSNKKSNRSKKLVARRGPHRSTGEEAIELAVSSSEEDGENANASSGSESDDPDTEEEADLQNKRLVLEKLSLERKEDSHPQARTLSRKQLQKNRGRNASQDSQPSQPSSQNRDSAPASPTPSPSSPVPNSSTPSAKKRRNRKSKQLDQKSTVPVNEKDNSQSQKDGNEDTHSRTSSALTSSQSGQPTDPEPTASPSKTNKKFSKQGASKQNTPSPAKDGPGVESVVTDWGDSEMPEQTLAAEKSADNQSQPQEQNKSTAHLGRPVSRGRGGRAAAMARDEYRKKLAEDPRFVPHLGEFWGHDDRYRGAGLKNFSDRGGFRGQFMGRGGFGRGNLHHGPQRGDVRNESFDNNDKDTQSKETINDNNNNKGGNNEVKPRSDRWSHDGFDQLMKVQEKSYRHQRSDSRPRSMNAKASGAPLSRTSSNNVALGQSASIHTSTTESSKSVSKSNDSAPVKSTSRFNDNNTSKVADKQKSSDSQDKSSTQSKEEIVQHQNSPNSTPTKAERPRSSAQFGEKDVRRASRLLNSALPKPAPKTPAAEVTVDSSSANGVESTNSKDDPKDNADAGSLEKTENSPNPAVAQKASTPKPRQPMPQNQPTVHQTGFRPPFIPGNFSSRGRGRGQSNHPGGFGQRGGHHGHHHHHHHHHHSHPQQSASTETLKEDIASDNNNSINDTNNNNSGNSSTSKLVSESYPETEQSDSAHPIESHESNTTAGVDPQTSKDTTPVSSSKSLKTAINAVPFKPSTQYAPTEQSVEPHPEEEYYGEYSTEDGYYYDPQMTQPMYYYYYPPGSTPTSVPMGVPVHMGVPVPMGVPMGLPMPMPGQGYMPPMYYDANVTMPGSMPPNGGATSAPGPNGEMMMMMAPPEDYNNYYYYPPQMYYPPHPQAPHNGTHQPHHQHPNTQTTQSV